MRSRALLLTAVAALAAASCRDSAVSDPHPQPPLPAGTLEASFSVTSTQTGVPRDLLVAVARVEDGLRVPKERTVRLDVIVPAAGPLQLRHGHFDSLKRGAALVGASELDLRAHGDLALEAGARVLAELGARTGARADDLASWNAALEEMSGMADAPHREHYAHQVFATLAQGGTFPARDGEQIVLPRHGLAPSLTFDLSEQLHVLANQAQYPSAEWIPTSCKNKCDPDRAGQHVELVVIHDTEGNWNASVATLQNDPEKSVQYIVGTDGRVAQFVTEDVTAWHSGNRSYNERSVGIEHVGYDDQPFTEAQYAASAKLVDYLTAKYAVPKDRAHIIGHDQVPNGEKISSSGPPCGEAPATCEKSDDWGGANNHRDPGIWEWATYMPRFGGSAKCNDTSSDWTCSFDGTKRLRCASDSVDVETCAGCSSSVTCLAPQVEPPAPAGSAAAPPAGPPPESGCAMSPVRSRGPGGALAGSFAAMLAWSALGLVRRGRRRRR